MLPGRLGKAHLPWAPWLFSISVRHTGEAGGVTSGLGICFLRLWQLMGCLVGFPLRAWIQVCLLLMGMGQLQA